MYGSYIEANMKWSSTSVLHKAWIATNVLSNGGWLTLQNRYAVENDTVGQFTGLTDTNGVRIFEGDVVRIDSGGSGFAPLEIVSYSNGGFSPFSCAGHELEPYADDCEVVGNIHDDPELRRIAGRH